MASTENVTPAPPEPARDAPVPDAYVSLPLLADPHVHLDKALTADDVTNARGDLGGAIEAWLTFRNSQTTEQIRTRARRAALAFVLNGTTALRTHVDTGEDIGLRAVQALAAVRDELASIVDIQIVACAFLPLTGAGATGSGNGRARAPCGSRSARRGPVAG